MRSSIQEAFAKINNLPPQLKESLRKADKRSEKDKDTNYKLSYKTYQKLKATGYVE